MSFRSLTQGIRNFFGPNNRFFNGSREAAPAAESFMSQAAPDPSFQASAQPQQQGPYYQPQQTPYGQQQIPYGQPASSGYYQSQPGPYAAQPQQAPNRAPAGFAQPMRQPQQPAGEFQQQTVNQPYVPPRNRRAAQHAQTAQPVENVVPFPAGQAQQGAPAAQPQQSAAPEQKKPSACVINVRNIGDCRSAIGILRAGDCVVAVIDSIADPSEVRRYVDTLNGACFSLGCTMTRTSARVGVYFLAPAGMQVLTDPTTTQMNAQSRAPQRARSGQTVFQSQPAARGAYPPAPQYAPVRQPVYSQQPQAGYASQQPAQGYTPDQGGDYPQDAVM